MTTLSVEGIRIVWLFVGFFFLPLVQFVSLDASFSFFFSLWTTNESQQQQTLNNTSQSCRHACIRRIRGRLCVVSVGVSGICVSLTCCRSHILRSARISFFFSSLATTSSHIKLHLNSPGKYTAGPVAAEYSSSLPVGGMKQSKGLVNAKRIYKYFNRSWPVKNILFICRSLSTCSCLLPCATLHSVTLSCSLYTLWPWKTISHRSVTSQRDWNPK